jgi:HSP20 family protein
MTTHLRVFEPGISDTFESALRRLFSPVPLDINAQAIQMRVDVSEKKDAYVVKADLPGVKKDDINVRIDGNIVQIDAEVKQEKETRGRGNRIARTPRRRCSVAYSLIMEDRPLARSQHMCWPPLIEKLAPVVKAARCDTR